MKRMTYYGPALLALGLLLLADPAMAEDFGKGAERIAGQLEYVAKLISIISFVSGLGIGMSGILKLKNHSQNPAQVPLSQPMMRILVACGLIALPTAMGNGIDSLFGEDATTLTATNGITEINTD